MFCSPIGMVIWRRPDTVAVGVRLRHGPPFLVTTATVHAFWYIVLIFRCALAVAVDHQWR